MTDPQDTIGSPPETIASPHKPDYRKRGKIGSVSITGFPSEEELAQNNARHKGEKEDEFTLYTPQQIKEATKPCRITVTFEDTLTVRDQAEMVKACMDVIIQLTRQRGIGQIRQRIETRREMASLGERLSLMNGKTPAGYARKK